MRAHVDWDAAVKVELTEGVLRHLTHCARVVRDIALASNPPTLTGAYRSSFKVRRASRARVMATMTADDRKANWLEYGTNSPSPHFDVITRAVRRAGFARVDFIAKARKGREGRAKKRGDR